MSNIVCKECLDKSGIECECISLGMIGERSCDICGSVINWKKDSYYFLRDEAFARLKNIVEKQANAQQAIKAEPQADITPCINAPACKFEGTNVCRQCVNESEFYPA